jgi:thymidylate kinase
VRVPRQGAELVVFTVRMMLKHTALVELLLLARGKSRKQLQQEALWLTQAAAGSSDALSEARELAGRWLPSVDPALFASCLAALTTPTPLGRRIVLGRRLRRQLRPYARQSAWRTRVAGLATFLGLVSHRLVGSRRDKALASGGAVIAFVGPEASGKSTLLVELSRWLSEDLAVTRLHAGKPPSTVLTALPNLLVPALRRLMPSARSTRIEADHASADGREGLKPYPLLFAVRAVLLAYDRRALLLRAFREAANGSIVLCDRYPSQGGGAPDGPQLPSLPLPPGGSGWRRLLARLEARLYRDIPPPDLVVQLSVPLEVAVVRNAERDKREPEDYVRRRHSLIANLDFGRTPVHRIQTDRPVAETVLLAKRAVWGAL